MLTEYRLKIVNKMLLDQAHKFLIKSQLNRHGRKSWSKFLIKNTFFRIQWEFFFFCKFQPVPEKTWAGNAPRDTRNRKFSYLEKNTKKKLNHHCPSFILLFFFNTIGYVNISVIWDIIKKGSFENLGDSLLT